MNIRWPCDMVGASKRNESKVRHILHRKGEWGRGRDLPQHRLDEISEVANHNGMSLYQALSLRRSLLRSFPDGMRRVSQSSSMGSDEGQRLVADLLEKALASYLISCLGKKKGVFVTESDLLAEMKAGTRAKGPTPDVLFLKQVNINGHPVTWLDAKMYYGCALLANQTNLPVGRLRKQAERYNQYFGGTGAFVFGQGFCADLRVIVKHALLLDATPLDMSAIEAYQDANN